MKFLILACSLVFASGCLTKPTLGGKAGTSKLNTNNLVKNPSTGIYTVKSSQQQNPTVRADAATRNFNSTNSPAEPLSKGGILPPKGQVESRNIPPPQTAKESSPDIVLNISDEGKSGKTKVPVKIDWVKLILYYLFALHVIVICYVAHKKGLFQKIKSPFVEKKIKNV